MQIKHRIVIVVATSYRAYRNWVSFFELSTKHFVYASRPSRMKCRTGLVYVKLPPDKKEASSKDYQNVLNYIDVYTKRYNFVKLELTGHMAVPPEFKIPFKEMGYYLTSEKGVISFCDGKLT